MKRLFLLILSFMFLGGAVSSSAFYINSSLNAVEHETSGGGEFTTSENENLDDVTANAPTNDEYWTDSGNYATSFAGGTGTETDPYLISTPQQLAYLSYLINIYSLPSLYCSKYYEQTADLDMSAYYWDAIGYNSNGRYFCGGFDGGGYTISGLFTESDSDYQGLFGFVRCLESDKNYYIRDVHIINSTIQGGSDVGGIIGYIGASIWSLSLEIHDCSMSGAVAGRYGVGGIIGGIGLSSDNSIEAKIYDCCNYASIRLSEVTASNGGGIIGTASLSERCNLLVAKCFNVGDVISESGHCGGIIGVGRSSYVNFCVTIGNCYNRGNVESEEYVGGIIGYVDKYATIYNCYNTGLISGDVMRAIIGAVSVSATAFSSFNAGSSLGIGGSNSNNSRIDENYENCLNRDWYNGWVPYPWDFDSVWAMDEDINDGLPYLQDVVDIMVSTITYHPNGASGDEVVESKTGSESYTIRSNMFTRSGYNFTGWNTQANGGGTSYSAGSSYSDLANLDLYAQWSRITYTITYNKNASDATGTMASTTKYYGTNVTLRSNAFKRTGYSFAGWATSSGGAVVYANGATYSANASVTLYAKWDPHKYTIVFNGNGSTSGSMKEQTFEYGKEQKLTSNAFKKTGFTFSKWTRNSDGTGTSYTNGQSVKNLTSTNGATINLYAQWTARNEAKYDSAGKYWYVENGKIPQTKVTNSTLISNLNKATTNGANYYIAGQTLTAKVYSGKEYCKWNNNWYEVEPIKWRLDYSSSQKDGYGTTTDTNAVLAEIVYVDQYSSSSIDAGEGYSNQSVTDFMRNGISTTYLVNYATSTQTFGTGASLYGTNASTTARMFVSSQSEINAVNGTMNITFSDLVEDMIKYYGGTNVYFTRDLGSNYNNIVCFNEVGREVQRFATDYRGLQFTVRFTEYGCVA